MRKIFLLLVVLLLITPVFAQVPDYKDKYVNDFANVLNENQTNELRLLFSTTDQETTAEMTLLTVDTVAPMAMSQYAQEVFDKWQIGKSDKDNGLLILYSKQEDKIWVSTGYGLGGILPDSKVGRILDETFVPARTNNDSASGIILAAQEYANVINENADEVRSGNASGSYQIDFLPVIFMLVWLSVIISGLLRGMAPKCKCGERMKIVNVEKITDKKKGLFGIEYETHHSLVTYRCPKCGKEIVKKEKREYRKNGVIFVPVGGHSGGGFSGGFSGGGGGGGGAGR